MALAALLLGAIVAFGVGMQIYSSDYYTRRGTFVRQPVPFSHKHHAGDLGIDCRYCHTSVETSSFAGIPSPSTCMHCHSQMWDGAPMLEPVRHAYASAEPLAWVRVHDLPDYVYFDHSIHIAKGIGCASCHGRMDEMPLTRRQAGLQMVWCLNCHRNPERFVRPREEVFNMSWKPSEPQEALGARLVAEYRIEKKTDCDTCHR